MWGADTEKWRGLYKVTGKYDLPVSDQLLAQNGQILPVSEQLLVQNFHKNFGPNWTKSWSETGKLHFSVINIEIYRSVVPQVTLNILALK